MDKGNALEIGIIVKTRGISGEIILEVKDSDVLKNIKESVHLDIDGLLVPFFIESVRIMSSNRARIQFDWIDSEKSASNLISRTVHIPLKELTINAEEKSFSPNLLEGFSVIDKSHGSIGIIAQYIDQANNPLLIINNKNNEIIIPFQDDLIEKISMDDKAIHINSPEGLIDLYLE